MSNAPDLIAMKVAAMIAAEIAVKIPQHAATEIAVTIVMIVVTVLIDSHSYHHCLSSVTVIYHHVLVIFAVISSCFSIFLP